MTVSKFPRNQQFVDDSGRLTPLAYQFASLLADISPFIGTSSPETVVEASQGRFFVRTDGVAGTVLYVKRDADVSGSRDEGWIAVSVQLSADNVWTGEQTFSGGYLRSVTTGITAGTPQDQDNATLLTAEDNYVETVGVANDGVKLPAAAAGKHVLIINEDANGVKVWPSSGDAIDGGAVDAADSNILTGGSARRYTAKDATNWLTV